MTIVDDFEDLKIAAENSIVKMMTAFTQAILEEIVNLKSGEDAEHVAHVSEVNRVRIDAVLTKLESIDPQEWDKWCEVGQATFIVMLRTNVAKSFAKKK